MTPHPLTRTSVPAGSTPAAAPRRWALGPPVGMTGTRAAADADARPLQCHGRGRRLGRGSCPHPIMIFTTGCGWPRGGGRGCQVVPTSIASQSLCSPSLPPPPLIPTIRFAAVTADVGVVRHVRWSTSLRRLGSNVRWIMPTVRSPPSHRSFAARHGVWHRVCWSTRRWGRLGRYTACRNCVSCS